MANIVITSNNNAIKIDFNELTPENGFKQSQQFPKTSIEQVNIITNDEYVEVLIKGMPWLILTHDGAKGKEIDSIDGDSMDTNQEIYNKLFTVIWGGLL